VHRPPVKGVRVTEERSPAPRPFGRSEVRFEVAVGYGDEQRGSPFWAPPNESDGGKY
jgi:hypothetical protein